MPKTVEVTLKIKLRKLRGEEIEEQGYDREDVTEFDLDVIEASDLADALNGYFENAIEEFAPEIAVDFAEPYTVSKITASVPAKQRPSTESQDAS